MPTMPQLAQALQGFGAGVQGRGSEFTTQLDEKRQQALLEDAFRVQRSLRANDVSTAQSILENRIQHIQRLGGDPKDTIGVYRKLMGGDVQGAMQDVSTAVEYGVQTGRLQPPEAPGGVEYSNFEQMTAGMSPEDVELARRIRMGLSPRAVANAEMTMTGQGPATVSAVADTVQTLSGAKETGVLTAQTQLAPNLRSLVTAAESEAKRLADLVVQGDADTRAYDVYNSAMSGLVSGLSGSETGPIVGWIPAVTTNQQVAKASIAAMAPVMKQMFRAAGEGIFTDKDQELLLDMLPTRKTNEKAIPTILSNIDTIVKAKLRMFRELDEPDTATTGAATLNFDAEGNLIP